ncbi:hypothetical protein LD39_03020 [Halobacillus sp. BBL2006]|nr:hypothetical protein LD39_03020 [Halobacillus sp. BBL2006]
MFSGEQANRIIEIKPVMSKGLSSSDIQKQSNSEVQQIEDMKNKAEQQLEAAQNQVETLIEETDARIQAEKLAWKKEREELVKEAESSGYKAGFQKGKEQGFMEYSAKLQEANEIMKSAHESSQSIVNASDEIMADIALRCAEKIMDQHLHQSPEYFIPIVNKVIKEVQGQSGITIFVHPDQYRYVLAQREELKRLTDIHTEISIYTKDGIQPFSCLVETSFGRVDASIDSQLSELRQKILECVDEGTPHE